MSKKLALFGSLLLMCAGLGSKVQSCSPAQYCKDAYPGLVNVRDQMRCTYYCSKQPDVDSDPNLKAPCELGQWLYLKGPRKSSLVPARNCKELLKDEYLAQACRLGVNAEERRTIKYREDNGSAGDRENGN